MSSSSSLASNNITTTEANQPRTDDLSAELDRVYKENFVFKGSSHHISSLPNAPSPGLTVAGVGLVGLPLSERDANLIIAEGSKPQRKARGVAIGSPSTTTTPTGAIEFSPSKISFDNPEWSTFVSEHASKQLWKTLGAPAFTSQPRCQLVKATLHKPGSSSPDTRDLPKPDGTFATVTFVLPSAHAGGQVHLFQTPTVLDTSKESGFSTYVLAWYNGINHSVQPVTSGYRLALVYALIHTSPNTPRPSLPTVHAGTVAITAVLQKWRDGKYKTLPEIPLAAFVLRDRGDYDLKVQDLKGMDAHLLKCLLPAAKTLGFCVGLAQMKKTVKGEPHRDHWTYRHRNGYSGYHDSGYDEDWYEDHESYRIGDYDTPDMGDIESEEQDIRNFSRVDGGKVVDLGKFSVEEDNVVPQDAFDGDDVYPDEEGFNRDFCKVTYEYDRAVAIIFRAEDETNLAIRTKGAFSFLKQLEASSKPTPLHKLVVASALERLDGKRYERYVPGELDNATAAVILLGHALRWKDQVLWNKAISHCESSAMDAVISAIGSAVKTFKIDAIKQGLSELVKKSQGLQRKLDTLKAISDSSPRKSEVAWVDDTVTHILSTYAEPKTADVRALVNVAEQRGPEVLQTNVLPNIKPSDTYDFLVALTKALVALRDKPTTPAPLKLRLSQLIRQCLSLTMPQWEPTGYYSYYGNTKAKRVSDLVELCLTIGDLEPCTQLFNSVLFLDKDPAKMTKDHITDILVPLVPLLQTTLTKFGKPITLEPFASFLRNIVSLYLAQVLGEKTELPPLPSTGDIGCGCAECAHLNAFLRGTESSTKFKATQAKRNHVESTIKKHKTHLDRIVTTETVKSGTPHCLVVSRRPEVLEALKWTTRQGAAKAFLKGVAGDERVLRQVMGERYEDVVRALDGTKVFVLGSLEILPSGVPAASGAVPGEGTASASKRKRSGTSAAETASAKTKRKA